jgi:hypothetical protein
MDRTKRIVGALSLGLLLGSCQGYDVDPVVPHAIKVADKPVTIQGHQLAPNIMFVVDKSGSMTDPATGSGAGCANANQGYNGNRSSDCKWNNLLNVMVGDGTTNNPGFVNQVNSSLSLNGDQVRLGLTYFASDNSCGVGQVAVPVPGGATDNSGAIIQTLNGLAPSGATPTAATMEELLQPGIFPATADRGNYAILMTDGAPNCNTNIQPTSALCGGDRCTGGTCSDWSTCGCNPAAGGDVRLCLDDTGLVSAITDVANGGIKTFVIGFGADAAAGSAAATLNSAAIAGGEFRQDANHQPQSVAYYQASDISDLQAALTAILGSIGTGNCQYQLDGAPPSKELIQVLVTAPGANSCTTDTDCGSDSSASCASGKCATIVDQSNLSLNGSSLTISGSACDTIDSANPNSPAAVEFRYLSN